MTTTEAARSPLYTGAKPPGEATHVAAVLVLTGEASLRQLPARGRVPSADSKRLATP
jgi:hypothetical protein